jgi:hypothetical protein
MLPLANVMADMSTLPRRTVEETAGLVRKGLPRRALLHCDRKPVAAAVACLASSGVGLNSCAT